MTLHPLRVVLHSEYGDSPHLDLFIRVGGRESLVSYEISSQFMEEALRLFEKIGANGVVHCIDAPESAPGSSGSVTGGNAVPAFRKGEHRSIYWEYEGPLSGGRGAIRQIGRFWIEGEPIDSQRLLLHI